MEEELVTQQHRDQKRRRWIASLSMAALHDWASFRPITSSGLQQRHLVVFLCSICTYDYSSRDANNYSTFDWLPFKLTLTPKNSLKRAATPALTRPSCTCPVRKCLFFRLNKECCLKSRRWLLKVHILQLKFAYVIKILSTNNFRLACDVQVM